MKLACSEGTTKYAKGGKMEEERIIFKEESHRFIDEHRAQAINYLKSTS